MTIDTLQIYEQLRSSSLPDEAAKGIANVIKNVTESELANKQDIAEIHRDIAEIQAEVHRDIAGIQAENRRDIADLHNANEQLRAEIKQSIEMAKIELRRDIANTKADLLKWMAGMLVTQAVVIAAIVKLL